MLLMDSSKKISFNLCIRDGDLVIVYERYDSMKAVKVCENSVLQNRFGVFKHSDWIGKPFSSKVFSNKGGFVYILAPTPDLWTSVLSHRTQILYIADISFVVMYLEVVPGWLVLESGTGSGSHHLQGLCLLRDMCILLISTNRGLPQPGKPYAFRL
ncbi:tRNA (adenine(58)-N(1))-methyltransferase catalytic subunit TRMT61A [Hibiscus syriacus]|uniref:tRNA (adenine(58)-N(1))-methyltransferase n=1 Tax=Hibiscus syriacus TaxID=106335 RepID=A0A6A3BKH5_HIBSY|nr:tRNA (adenine(58)-N(1))-methyltransferase catalytic subunit TRMT61A [Hibiscus syriacus]